MGNEQCTTRYAQSVQGRWVTEGQTACGGAVGEIWRGRANRAANGCRAGIASQLRAVIERKAEPPETCRPRGAPEAIARDRPKLLGRRRARPPGPSRGRPKMPPLNDTNGSIGKKWRGFPKSSPSEGLFGRILTVRPGGSQKGGARRPKRRARSAAFAPFCRCNCADRQKEPLSVQWRSPRNERRGAAGAALRREPCSNSRTPWTNICLTCASSAVPLRARPRPTGTT